MSGKILEDKLLASVTVRISFKFIEELEKKVGRGKKFPDKSAGIRYYLERGQQFESLLEIYNNPEKRKEFESKMQALAKVKDIEKFISTIDDPAMIDAIIFTATNQKDARVRQLLLEFK